MTLGTPFLFVVLMSSEKTVKTGPMVTSIDTTLPTFIKYQNLRDPLIYRHTVLPTSSFVRNGEDWVVQTIQYTNQLWSTLKPGCHVPSVLTLQDVCVSVTYPLRESTGIEHSLLFLSLCRGRTVSKWRWFLSGREVRGNNRQNYICSSSPTRKRYV